MGLSAGRRANGWLMPGVPPGRECPSALPVSRAAIQSVGQPYHLQKQQSPVTRAEWSRCWDSNPGRPAYRLSAPRRSSCIESPLGLSGTPLKQKSPPRRTRAGKRWPEPARRQTEKPAGCEPCGLCVILGVSEHLGSSPRHQSAGSRLIGGRRGLSTAP